ncbi:hypothetical protein AALP_AAs56912U000200 [Arabis alpina]|uniref:LRAT domain-containing protein n=1 Tax=Arabis alpina TaxID=50452 RepID=A0A087G2A8_ARAAL|nr:hypothetical protein AALP_AAs56912U000200 [Arabis alpina]
MGLLSNKISRDDLKPGDHIYSWRTAFVYAHHGIYVGDGKVIHFTQGNGREAGTGTFLDDIIVSSVPKANHGGDNIPCPKCGDQSNLNGVISSCLDCFLAGGNLYFFEYNVSKAFFMAFPRGGTCTTAPSDSPEQVIFRAKFLLSKTEFGRYDLLKNNCEDFTIYCKTGLVIFSKLGSSGQANSVAAARNVFSWSFAGSVASLGSAAKYALSSTAGFAVTGFGGVVLVGYGQYCVGRLNSDIGVRNDATKIAVEKLVELIPTIEGVSDNNNNKCS